MIFLLIGQLRYLFLSINETALAFPLLKLFSYSLQFQANEIKVFD